MGSTLVWENIKDFAHGKKVSKKAFVKIFTDAFTGDSLNDVLFGIPIDKVISFLKLGKYTKFAEFLVGLLL